jgi:acyl carrier protein
MFSGMTGPISIDIIVRDIVRARASRAVTDATLPGNLTLGAEGLGLDSIAIAELLLDCEQRFGVSVISLLEGEPLTLTRLIAHLKEALQQESIA